MDQDICSSGSGEQDSLHALSWAGDIATAPCVVLPGLTWVSTVKPGKSCALKSEVALHCHHEEFPFLKMQDAPKHYSLLSTPDVEYWRHTRKTISEAFSPAAMRKVGASGQAALLGDTTVSRHGTENTVPCTAQQAPSQASGQPCLSPDQVVHRCP